MQRKFQVLTCLFEQWLAGDIHDIIMTCVILHNVMVSVRMDQNEEESNVFYESLDLNNGNELVDCSVALDQEEDNVLQCWWDFWVTFHCKMSRQTRCWEKEPAFQRAMLSFQMNVVQQHWLNLCDKDAHNLLREAIILEQASRQTNEDKLL